MKNIKTNWDYSQLAKNYDHRADYDLSLIKKVLNDFGCKKNFPVADIGAGTGKLTKQLLKQNLIVSAVEPNSNMRKFGIKNCKNFDKINWSAATAENTGLFEKNIYAVFFGSSFNVVDYKKVFKELKRILIKNGYFCCLWNHRDLEDPLQKRVEGIIKKYVKKYSYGERRGNVIPILKESNLFKKIKFLEKKFFHSTPKQTYIQAWKSHGTLKRQANKNFKNIIGEISKEINKNDEEYIKVPFKTVVYYAQLKN